MTIKRDSASLTHVIRLSCTDLGRGGIRSGESNGYDHEVD